MENYYLITFENTLNAMNGEEVLKKESIAANVMPTPTYITKSCGLSLKISPDEIDKVKKIIGQDKIKIKKLYYKNSTDFIEVEI